MWFDNAVDSVVSHNISSIEYLQPMTQNRRVLKSFCTCANSDFRKLSNEENIDIKICVEG